MPREQGLVSSVLFNYTQDILCNWSNYAPPQLSHLEQVSGCREGPREWSKVSAPTSGTKNFEGARFPKFKQVKSKVFLLLSDSLKKLCPIMILTGKPGQLKPVCGDRVKILHKITS